MVPKITVNAEAAEGPFKPFIVFQEVLLQKDTIRVIVSGDGCFDNMGMPTRLLPELGLRMLVIHYESRPSVERRLSTWR